MGKAYRIIEAGGLLMTLDSSDHKLDGGFLAKLRGMIFTGDISLAQREANGSLTVRRERRRRGTSGVERSDCQ